VGGSDGQTDQTDQIRQTRKQNWKMTDNIAGVEIAEVETGPP